MMIDPFILGIITTLAVEMVSLFIIALILGIKSSRKGK